MAKLELGIADKIKCIKQPKWWLDHEIVGLEFSVHMVTPGVSGSMIWPDIEIFNCEKGIRLCGVQIGNLNDSEYFELIKKYEIEPEPDTDKPVKMNIKDAMIALYEGKKVRSLPPHHEYILRDGKIDYVDETLKERMDLLIANDEFDCEWEIVEDD